MVKWSLPLDLVYALIWGALSFPPKYPEILKRERLQTLISWNICARKFGSNLIQEFSYSYIGECNSFFRHFWKRRQLNLARNTPKRKVDFAPEISWIFRWMVCILEIQPIPVFSGKKLSQGISVPLAPVSKVWNCWPNRDESKNALLNQKCRENSRHFWLFFAESESEVKLYN